ncbi:hypothetical protein HDV01_007066 [Terramyces sp. JEL0728]|nr:hypothetical protein HDV01_007066 [Terramyces sp. JEL0728]
MTTIDIKQSPLEIPSEKAFLKIDSTGVHSSSPATKRFIEDHPILATAAAIPVGAVIAVGAVAVAGAAVIASPIIYAMGGKVEYKKGGIIIGGQEPESK